MPVELEAGDLLWPRQPTALIPYSSALDPDQERWLETRRVVVDRLIKSAESDADWQLIGELRDMNYQQFVEYYGQGREPSLLTPFGAGAVVGHVALVDKDASGNVWIIEALLEGVVRRSHADWASSAKGAVFWHGRLREFDATRRALISIEARKFVGLPYDFVNWQLDDASGFYCSKLVWLAIKNAIGIAIDGNDDPARRFWLSPKQILGSDNITLLRDPGAYGLPTSCPDGAL